MEKKFAAAWARNREKAEALGIRMRPVAEEEALKNARRILSGNRLSDGFNQLQAKGKLSLSLEALVVDKRFTALFTDEEANEALMRLLDAGYCFQKNCRGGPCVGPKPWSMPEAKRVGQLLRSYTDIQLKTLSRRVEVFYRKIIMRRDFMIF